MLRSNGYKDTLNGKVQDMAFYVVKISVKNLNSEIGPYLSFGRLIIRVTHNAPCVHRFHRVLFSRVLGVLLVNANANDDLNGGGALIFVVRTPDIKKKHTNQQRKALNYQSVEVTKELFEDKQKSKPVKPAKERRRTEDRESEKKSTTVRKNLNVKMAQKRKFLVPSMKDVPESGPSGFQTKNGSAIYAKKIVLLI
ncbi:hypothetical protein FQA39_LY15695 [Lamprigera yunnana]|nr:hypothetical protein FQA39_LY15695 [Lamprigera yunnana]